MGYIYKIENTVDNKIYIGQTMQDLETRWKQHLKKSSNCRYLKSAIQKYGIDNFEFKLVCITFDNQLDDMEKEYIEQYDCLAPNGYNLRLGGNSENHHTDTKRKIANTLLQNRKIIQFDIEGNRLKSFYCLREAAESVGCSPSSIGYCTWPLFNRNSTSFLSLMLTVKLKSTTSLSNLSNSEFISGITLFIINLTIPFLPSILM